ncbi:hypothetical protein IC006_0922 [Sulfuracidifex tepidarius]|uniref:Uncharacterized protein n=1 Tax=Sulfuracidifex tepidarius TaxID=1294262 RepID=A0A510DU11_9CREN|nr:hypothetical protein [Sulfuracidifex tepidarius]BBG23634.1 hypothetical protein IC006_0922 [Sulfuracidifex tepidarius]
MIIRNVHKLHGIGTIPHLDLQHKDKIFLIKIDRFNYKEYVYNFSEDNFTLIWKLEFQVAGGTYNDLVEVKEKLIIPHSYNKISLVDKNNGTVLDTFQLSKEEILWRNKSTPCLLDDQTLIAPIGPYINIIEINDNSKFKLKNTIKLRDGILLLSRCKYVDNVLLSYAYDVYNSTYLLLVFDLKNNKEQYFKLCSAPLVAYNNVEIIPTKLEYIATCGSNIFLFNENNIDGIVQIEEEKNLHITPPAYDPNNDYLILATYSGKLYIIDLSSKTFKNVLPLPGKPTGKPIFVDANSVIIYSIPYLLKVNLKSLDIEDSLIIGYAPYSIPEINGDIVYAVGGDMPKNNFLAKIELAGKYNSKVEGVVDLNSNSLSLRVLNSEHLGTNDLIIDLYPLGVDRQIRINSIQNEIKINQFLNIDEVKKILFRKYYDNYYILLLYLGNNGGVMPALVKFYQEGKQNLSSSYLNVKLLNYLNSATDINDISLDNYIVKIAKVYFKYNLNINLEDDKILHIYNEVKKDAGKGDILRLIIDRILKELKININTYNIFDEYKYL